MPKNELEGEPLFRRGGGWHEITYAFVSVFFAHSCFAADDFVEVSSSDKDPSGGTLAQVTFDPAFVGGAGIPKEVASRLGRQVQFLPGEHLVEVDVNGRPRGKHIVLFGRNGQPCMTPKLLADLRIQAGDSAKDSLQGSCPPLTSIQARAIVSTDPNNLLLRITLPEEGISKVDLPTDALRGGAGGLINYSLTQFGSGGVAARSQSTTFLDTEIGFNAADWLIRSKSNYISNDGQSKHRWAGGYAQKTFVEHEKIFQVGRIVVQDPIAGGLPIDGAQWIPEASLKASSAAAPVEGVAFSRAKVEIYQQGRLIHTTIVPPGPFKLSDFLLPSTQHDLSVRVVESSGDERQFSVTSAELQLKSVQVEPQDLHVAVGRLYEPSGSKNGLRDHPVVITGSIGFGSRSLTNTVGAVAAANYLGLRLRSSFALNPNVLLNTQLNGANDSYDDARGLLGSAAVSYKLDSKLLLGASFNTRSNGYKELQDTYAFGAYSTTGRVRNQSVLSMNWNGEEFGGFGMRLIRQATFAGHKIDAFSLSYNNSWRSGKLSVGLSKQFDTRPNATNSSYAFIEASFPLGDSSDGRAFAHSVGRGLGTVYGSNYTKRVNEFIGLQAGIETNSKSSESAGSLGGNWANPITNVAFTLKGSDKHYSHTVQASGGIVFHEQGLAYSAQRIGDTFGVVKVGDVAGVAVDTPGGLTWTGEKGLAVIPNIPPYHSSRVDVRDVLLPDDVEVGGAQQMVLAGRGSVAELKVSARKVRRVLLKVHHEASGAPLPKGSGVMRGEDEFITMAASNGAVMLTDYKPEIAYSAVLPDNSVCKITAFELKARQYPDVFERGTAKCL